MLVGAHVSAAGGVWNAPKNAADLGLETFQFFSRPPQGGPAPKLGDEEVRKFKQAIKEYGFGDFAIHAPYYTNLGSVNSKIYHGTVSVLRQELERGSLLGASYVMFHPGSFKDLGQNRGMKQVISGVSKVLENYKGSTKLLVEISAGAGAICGDTFEELADILFGNQKYLGKTLGGICFDTQHAFAAGYDLRTEQAVAKVVKNLEQVVGLKYLKMIHANDSKVALGKCQDRHEHLGKGHIGTDGFKALAKFMTTHHASYNKSQSKKISLDLPWILETKHELINKDISILKKIKKEFEAK